MIEERAEPARSGLARALYRAAWPLFLVGIFSRIVWTVSGKNNFNFVDLRVYYEAARRVSDGGLYDFALSDLTPDQPLPFTYPPFAAVFLWPMKCLPFSVVAVLWLLISVGLLFLVIRMSLAILAAWRGAPSHLHDVPRELPLLWTAAVLWLDPVRTNFDYGQINMVIMALGVGAAYLLARTPVALALRPGRVDGAAGALVGIAAGIKLTPAVGGLFLLARGRVWAAAFSAVGFGATVAVSYLVLPAETRHYFTDLLGETGPIGRPSKPSNQSVRGTVSRFVGDDAGNTVVWIALVALAVALLGAAWWVVRRGDALITLLLVQFVGLLASPISWLHHFVWVVPLMVWLVHGPLGAAGAGPRFSAPGGAHTRWSTVLAVAVGLLWCLGPNFAADGLALAHLDTGPVRALLLALGPATAAALVALILANRERLRAVL